MSGCQVRGFREILEVLRGGLFLWCRKCGSRSVTHHNYTTGLYDPQDGEDKIFVEDVQGAGEAITRFGCLTCIQQGKYCDGPAKAEEQESG